MRKRHQTGGVRKQRGRWMGMWWVDGKRKSKCLGLIKDMTKGKAREEVARIVAEEDAKRQVDSLEVWRIRRANLFPLLQPEMEDLDAGKQREQDDSPSRIGVRRSGSAEFPAR
jgi:hypothetical protein